MLQTHLLPPPNQPLSLPPTHTTPTSSNNGTSNPPLFNAAMNVRITVFVDEQHVPLANEIDDDDRRSWHWVIFDSSAPSTKSSTLSPTTITEDSSQDVESANENEKKGTPIAVLRLVPPPHPPHETFAHPETTTSLPRYDLHSEPCVRITRVAVLPEYRGLGLGRKLVEMAVRWVSCHAGEVQRVYEETIKEYGGVEGEKKGRFNGLVLAHAQTSVEGMYARLGFECDEGLGRWEEEGIEHVGMTLRAPLSSSSSSS